MANMEELQNQISVEITRRRTAKLFITNVDSHYASGLMKLSKETSRQCVFAIAEGKFSGYYRLKKRFYGLADIPTILQEIFDRTLGSSAPAWLDIIAVTRGNKQEHDKKLFYKLNKLEKAVY